jgi:hypothetical protein
MTHVHYDEAQTVAQARATYFEVNRFGADGGYGDAWVDFKLGPVPFPIPNTKARVRAVRYHDLHHVLTGYDTNIIGEFEISAWEIGAGCKGYVAAWQLNLGGMFAGLLSAPVRTVRAFFRGRHSQSLYGRPFEPLLLQSVGDLRRECRVAEQRAPGVPDYVLLALATIAGLLVGILSLIFTLPMVPVGLAVFAARRASQRRSAARARS